MTSLRLDELVANGLIKSYKYYDEKLKFYNRYSEAITIEFNDEEFITIQSVLSGEDTKLEIY